ncbi:MAG: hypothetical protein NUW37_12715 [Planctomycetes bacterium]|nr:hypothetical protein [Planctomycetota bacterium]
MSFEIDLPESAELADAVAGFGLTDHARIFEIAPGFEAPEIGGKIVLVTGASGSGKSWLLRQLRMTNYELITRFTRKMPWWMDSFQKSRMKNRKS